MIYFYIILITDWLPLSLISKVGNCPCEAKWKSRSLDDENEATYADNDAEGSIEVGTNFYAFIVYGPFFKAKSTSSIDSIAILSVAADSSRASRAELRIEDAQNNNFERDVQPGRGVSTSAVEQRLQISSAQVQVVYQEQYWK